MHPGKWQHVFFLFVCFLFFCSKLHNYITISKQDAVWLSLLRGGRLFTGGKFTEVLVRRVDLCSDFFFSLKVAWQSCLALLPRTDAVFCAEMWQRVIKTDRMTEAFSHKTDSFKAAVWSFGEKVDLARRFEWYSSWVPPSSSLLCCSSAFKAPPTEEPAVQACNHGNRGRQITKMGH